MNDRAYTPRFLETALQRALKAFPVVIVTGVRQTGKSTLIRHLDSKRLYLSLDDVDILERAQTHPDGIVGQAPRLTLDEQSPAVVTWKIWC